jgi:hypothetical protein
MKQLEPKENQSSETEEEAWTDVPEPEGMLLGDPLQEEEGEEETPLGDPPCPCPCPCPCGEE